MTIIYAIRLIVLVCTPTENLSTNKLCDSMPVIDHKAESKTFIQMRLSNFILEITVHQGLKTWLKLWRNATLSYINLSNPTRIWKLVLLFVVTIRLIPEFRSISDNAGIVFLRLSCIHVATDDASWFNRLSLSGQVLTYSHSSFPIKV